MPIDATSLQKLVQSALNRYSVTNPTEVAKINEALNPGGVLSAMITAVNGLSAGPPSGTQSGAHAIFYSGQLTQGFAWEAVAKIVAKSGGTKYSIDVTDAGKYINNDVNYQSAFTWFQSQLGTLSVPLQSAIRQIIGGAASYNYASSAPDISDVVFGTNVDPNSVLLSVEIPRFSTAHPTGTWNGVTVSQLASSVYDPSSPLGNYNATKPTLVAATKYINFLESDGTYALTYGAAINSQSGNTLLVSMSNGGVNVSKDAFVQLSGNYNSVSSLNNATITLTTGSRGNDISMNSGHFNVQNNTGGWGADAITLRGANNTVTAGIADVVLVQGSGNFISAGDSSYIGVLTGSSSTGIAMTHGTVFVGAGTHVALSGDNNTVQIAASDIQNLTWTGSSGQKVTFVEVNPDNSVQYITTHAPVAGNAHTLWRDTVSYLPNGAKLDEAKIYWDFTASIKYFNYTGVGTGWGDTTILFDASGKAIQQYTRDSDGSVYVTVFQNAALNRPTNVTYFFTSQSAADTAVASNSWQVAAINANPSQSANWSGAGAVIVAPTAGTPIIYGYGGDANNLPHYNSTGGALSGVSQIQWLAGLQTAMNQNSSAPTTFLGNNAVSWSSVAAAAGNLGAIAIDPLVLNLAGQSVVTSAQGENGVHFDMLGDGVQRQTGWVTPGEAILINGSQLPTNGTQFLTTRQLLDLDVNHDGVVTAVEGASLGVWQPGTSGSGGSVASLQQLGIAAINLDWKALWQPQPGVFTPMGQVDHGNLMSSTFTFVYDNGSVGLGADVTFEVSGDDGAAIAQAAALIQTAAGFSAAEMAGMTTLAAAAQNTNSPNVLAPPSSWQG